MVVTVLLFARVREAAGTPEATLDLCPGATGREVLDGLARRYPKAKPYLETSRLAVNERYEPWTAAIRPGDTLAVIPPVSGG
jgi:molybdopterin converting factor subunit 1